MTHEYVNMTHEYVTMTHKYVTVARKILQFCDESIHKAAARTRDQHHLSKRV